MNYFTSPPENGEHRFAGKALPHEHLVQIYDRPESLQMTLAEFVAAGLRAGEGVVVIAARDSLRELDLRLAALDFDTAPLRSNDQLIELDAEEALAQFMIDGWPDETRFREVAGGWIRRARGGGRAVRAFGEMVALLWANGRSAATIRLEHLWHEVCEAEAFCLFCAYPKAGFRPGADVALHEICASHTQVLAA